MPDSPLSPDSPESADALAARFDAQRGRLVGVAYRMLGSLAEADDAVQDAWLRLSRSETGAIDNLPGWLTTVVSRICLDMLRSRQSKREDALDVGDSGPTTQVVPHPEQDVLLAEGVSLALLAILDQLAPAERVAFVLHDMFDVPFDAIARILDRSPDAVRQLASRARRRVRPDSGGTLTTSEQRQALVAAFLDASRSGNLDALLRLLAPDVVLRADASAAAMGAQAEVRGTTAVAETFKGRAQVARLALLDGEPGLVWAVGGRPRVVFVFAIAGDAILAIDLVADPGRIDATTITLIDA